MSWWNSRALRVQDEIELERRGEPDEAKKGIKQEPKKAKKNLLERTGSCFETKSRSRVFPEDYERAKTSILDPRGTAAGKWSMIFFTAGLVSLFVDPLFFFLPIAQPDFCFDTGRSLQIVLTIARTVYDVFYVVHIFVQFRTAYIAPSSRVFGRGELVIDPWKIAYQYLVKGFWADVMAAVPLPQVTLGEAVREAAISFRSGYSLRRTGSNRSSNRFPSSRFPDQLIEIGSRPSISPSGSCFRSSKAASALPTFHYPFSLSLSEGLKMSESPIGSSAQSTNPVDASGPSGPSQPTGSPLQSSSPLNNDTNENEDEEVEILSDKVLDDDDNKKLRSLYWAHYNRVKIAGVYKAVCKYCGAKINGETNFTSHG